MPILPDGTIMMPRRRPRRSETPPPTSPYCARCRDRPARDSPHAGLAGRRIVPTLVDSSPARSSPPERGSIAAHPLTSIPTQHPAPPSHPPPPPPPSPHIHPTPHPLP